MYDKSEMLFVEDSVELLESGVQRHFVKRVVGRVPHGVVQWHLALQNLGFKAAKSRDANNRSKNWNQVDVEFSYQKLHFQNLF